MAAGGPADDDVPALPEVDDAPELRAGEGSGRHAPAGLAPGLVERSQGERSEVEQDFLIKQSIVGELEEFFPPEFLDKVKARFEARLAERDAPSAD